MDRGRAAVQEVLRGILPAPELGRACRAYYTARMRRGYRPLASGNT